MIYLLRLAVFILGLMTLVCAAAKWARAQPYPHGGEIGYGQNNPAASPTLSRGQSYPLRMTTLGVLIVVTPTATATP